MLVVLASRHDPVAQKLVSIWQPLDCRILSCEDLSEVGWKDYSSLLKESRAVVSGKIVPYKQIKGVLTLRPAIFKEELLHIKQSDRNYIAQEMNAFLLHWLNSLRCPVLNPPTPLCLSGSNWRPEQWVRAAATLGIPCCNIQKTAGYRSGALGKITEQTVKITYVGNKCINSPNKTLAEHTKRLGRYSNLRFFETHFIVRKSKYVFSHVNSWPEILSTNTLDVLYKYFLGKIT
jgi:hypothetical protein